MLAKATAHLTPAEQASLIASKIRTAAEFWSAVDESAKAATAPPAHPTGAKAGPAFLHELSRRTGLPAPRAKSVLERLATLEADELTGAPVQHLRSLWLLTLVLAFFGSAFALRSGPPPAADRVIVAPKRAVEAFRPIQADDLTVAPGPVQPGTFGDVATVIGRYPLRRLKAGDAVVEGAVSARPAPTLAGRVILSLTARGLPAAMTAQLPVTVTLVFSPKVQASGPPLRASDVLPLAETRAGDMVTAVVALRPDALTAIEPVLGSSDAVLASDVR